MAVEGEIKPDDIRNPHTRYERRGMNTRGVLMFFAFLVVFALFIHLSVLGLLKIFSKTTPLRRTATTPTYTAPPNVSPPAPVLQPDPVADLHNMRAQEDQILQGYAWVDQASGKVRIPIARAMQLIVERGLPSASGAAAAKTAQATPAKPGGAGK